MQTFQMLKEYGKQGQDFDTIVQGFLAFFDRKDHTMPRLIDALFEHLSRSQEIPTPLHIENIINPPRPKPDWPVYVDLKKKIHEGYFPLSTERKFLRDCEEYAMDRMNREGEAYAEAQRQIENHRLAIEHHD